MPLKIETQPIQFNENVNALGTVSALSLSGTHYGDGTLLSGVAKEDFVSSNFLNLTGGTITGATRINNNLTVIGDLSATGNSYFANTIYSTTSALSVINIGNTGPALYVGNDGTGDIASFYDIDANIEVLHIGGNNGTFPNVGIKTSTPNTDLTINGQVSSNNIIWDASGNSANWNSAHNISTAYQNTSSSFATSTFTDSKYLPLTGGTITGTTTLSAPVIVQNGSVTGISFGADTGNTTRTAGTQKVAYFTSVDQGANRTVEFLSYSSSSATNTPLNVGGRVGASVGSVSQINLNTGRTDVAGSTTRAVIDANGIRVLTGGLSAVGSLSASGGTSAQWNNAYSVATTYQSASGNWQNTFTNFQANSANYILNGGNTLGSTLLIGTNDSNTLNFETNSQVRMSVLGTGNIGIGTTTPNTALTVIGTVSAAGTVSIDVADETRSNPTISANTLTLNLNTATFFVVSLNANITTMTFSNPPANTRAYSFVLQFVADGTLRAVTWPITVKWPSGTAPTLTSTLNKTDTFTFVTHDNGANYFGFISAQNS